MVSTAERCAAWPDLLNELVRAFKQLHVQLLQAVNSNDSPISIWIAALERAPPIPFLEDVFVHQGLHPLSARLKARLISHGALVIYQDALTKRKIFELVANIGRVRSTTSLVISRRALPLGEALTDHEEYFLTALGEAGHHLSSDELARVIEGAISREEVHCDRLVELCRFARPFLKDSRGPKLRFENALAASFAVVTRGGTATYNSESSNVSGPDVKLLRNFLCKPTFDPRSGFRLGKAINRGRR